MPASTRQVRSRSEVRGRAAIAVSSRCCPTAPPPADTSTSPAPASLSAGGRVLDDIAGVVQLAGEALRRRRSCARSRRPADRRAPAGGRSNARSTRRSPPRAPVSTGSGRVPSRRSADASCFRVAIPSNGKQLEPHLPPAEGKELDQQHVRRRSLHRRRAAHHAAGASRRRLPGCRVSSSSCLKAGIARRRRQLQHAVSPSTGFPPLASVTWKPGALQRAARASRRAAGGRCPAGAGRRRRPS